MKYLIADRAWVTVVTFVVLLGFVFGALRAPNNNWDMLAYAGCAAALGEDDPVLVHREVYSAVQTELPAEEARELTSDGGYRSAVASSPESFERQLRFYRARLTYIGLVRVVHAAGFGWLRSTTVVSALAACALALLSWCWMRRLLPGLAGALLLVLLLWQCGIYAAARESSPDALAALLVVWGGWLLLQRQRALPAVLVFAVAILTRTDALIFAGALLLAAGFVRGERRVLAPLAALGACAGLLALTLLLQRVAGSYGWWTVFAHTFCGYAADPDAIVVGFQPAWLDTVRGNLGELNQRGAWVFFACLAVAFCGSSAHSPSRPLLRLLAVGLCAALGVRFLLFPALWERLVVAPYLLAGLFALQALTEGRLGRAQEPVEMSEPRG